MSYFLVDEAQQKRYKQEFRSFAANGRMTLSSKSKIKKKDWLEEMTSYGSNITEEWAERLWYCFDRDHSGTMDLGEYIAMSALLEGAPLDKQLEASFRMCDVNDDGVLTREEIIEMLKIVYSFSEAVSYHRCSSDNPLGPEELDSIRATTNEIFRQADVNGDGEIDMDEFKACMMNNPDVLGVLNQFQPVDR
eukprot:TRINITY_DN1912_c0_g1_i2.p1 TRINITY_DN1912_c0_g1~~TRINITY_DN1912_c0_g1_i2.p1  ORF type:complete len:192 (-),score=53.84 TRINITY_DN1912_c0_g1_i2:68-643(-)